MNYFDSTALVEHIVCTQVTEMTDNIENKFIPHPLLEAKLQDMVERMAAALQCPQDFILTSMLAAVSAAIGTRVKVDNKKYENNPLLWFCIVAPSGSNKSEPLNRILRPIKAIDKQMYNTYLRELEQWEADGSNGKPPIAKQSMMYDTTPEARYQILANNPQGLLWYSDELATLLDNMGRYTKSGEQKQMLSMWDGREFRIDRKGDRPIRIDKPFCSIIGTIQPGILVNKMSGGEFTDSGFNTRWLFCYPRELPEQRYSTYIFPDTELKPWEDLIGRIYEQLSGIDPENPIVAGLNNDASDDYGCYWNRLQDKADEAHQAQDEYLVSIYKKAQIQMLRLALIIHVLRFGGIPKDITIDAVSMAFAYETMEGFIDCAIRVKQDIESGGSKWTKKDLYRELISAYPKINQSEFARSIDKPQPYVNKMFRQK